MNKEIKAYLNEATPEHKEILLALHEIILSVASGVQEQYKWSRPVYATEKDFCYLQKTKKYVTLGFFDFDKVKTNKHLIMIQEVLK